MRAAWVQILLPPPIYVRVGNGKPLAAVRNSVRFGEQLAAVSSGLGAMQVRVLPLAPFEKATLGLVS